MPGRTLIFDVETHSATELFTMAPEEFVRLIGYKWSGEDHVTLTTDLDEIRDAIRSARWIIGHNIHSFDLPAVFGVKSDEPLELTMQGRVYDTWTHGALVNPAPSEYVDRFGRKAIADKPAAMKKWFSLDEQAHQLGVQGKTHDLKELAREFGGFGEIPVDDPRYRDYLVGDVRASEAVAMALLKLGPLNEYAMREQEIECRKFIISANGLRVDIAKATARRDELAARKDVILAELQSKYGLPTEGAAPWDTDPGKRAILSALADHAITARTRPDWPKTPVDAKRAEKLAEAKEKAEALRADLAGWMDEISSGELPPRSVAARQRWIARDSEKLEQLQQEPLPPYFGLSLSGDALIELTKDTAAEDLGAALAELKGQRSLSQLALDSVHPDGFVHPDITMLQRSGRWSTTEPGLTIWTNNGPGAVEKDYYIADSDDEVLIEFDMSNADARIIAAVSGDKRYAERFEPGADGHMINALAAWGEEIVSKDPKRYRKQAKPLGHGWSYGGRPRGLQKASGLPLETATEFCEGMDAAFFVLVAWQNRVRREARRNGYVVNDWGRRMPVEKGREYTQAPALLGQSGTREMICDILLEMPIPLLRRVKAQIHDALLLSIPKANAEAWRTHMLKLMYRTFKPKQGGQLIEFPADSGPAGRTWYEAIH
ncbi:DNA polymerase [Glycomyces mayteni]|uniref:DNA-directed DNA polymerase n=1 Tax=Glycomyces mayteni TaxID=543887 RepID=A0ABW2D3L9_9ACTN|nr:hypothetical protein GCM10025732_47820 [Glycomyces mayteni]